MEDFSTRKQGKGRKKASSQTSNTRWQSPKEEKKEGWRNVYKGSLDEGEGGIS